MKISKQAGKALVGGLFALALAAAVAAVALTFAPQLARNAEAATQNYPTGVSVYMTPMLACPGQPQGCTVTMQTPISFKIPYAARLIGFGAVTRSQLGTITVDMRANGTSLLSQSLTLSTSWSEATVATAAIADETSIAMVVNISGTNAAVSDLIIVPVFVR